MPKMSYTVNDFLREFVRDHRHWLTTKERLDGLSVEDRLDGLSADDIFKGFSVEDRLKGLSDDDIIKSLSLKDRFKCFFAGVSAENCFKGVPTEELLACVDELKSDPKRFLENLLKPTESG